MREVFCDPDPCIVGFYQSMLTEAGILCFVQNENATRGEVLAPLFYPRLCITDDARYDDAMALLKERRGTPTQDSDQWTCPACHNPTPANDYECEHCGAERPAGPEWICPACKESVPTSFDSCWNCQTVNPALPIPAEP
jgi:hypothetical protein